MALTVEIRRCEQCGTALPESSRPQRVFCSVRCRSKHWDLANRPQLLEPVRVRLHWHCDPYQVLAGDYRAGYWRGPEGCPPECEGVSAAGWSAAVPEGREGLFPDPPRRRRAATGTTRPTPLRKRPRPPQTAQDGRAVPR